MPASSYTNGIVISHGVDKLFNSGLSLTMKFSINAEAEWLQIFDGATTVHVAPNFFFYIYFFLKTKQKTQILTFFLLTHNVSLAQKESQSAFWGLSSGWVIKKNVNFYACLPVILGLP